jgi:DNA-binding transcriptional regulator YiaG
MTASKQSRNTDTPDSTPDQAPPETISPADVREKAGLSTAEMADLLGMSASGYSQWEAGTRRPGGPAYRLLHLISREGQTVIDALRKIEV